MTTTTQAATTQPNDDQQPELTPAHIADGIRHELATIRRHWPHTFDPPKTGNGNGGAHAVPDSRLPGSDTAISLRTAVVRDLAFWLDAFIRANDDAFRELLEGWHTIDAGDVERTCRFLAQHSDDLGHWEFGNRLWVELEKHALDVKRLACPPLRDSMPIGECPIDVDGPYGPERCGGIVRVHQTKAGATCPKCKTWAVVDWWYGQIMGNPETKDLVTASDLVTIAAFELHVIVQQATIRKWVERGTLKASDQKDPKGRTLFDRATAMDVIRQRTKAGAA